MLDFNYMTVKEAEAVNNLMPGNSVYGVGSRLRNALAVGMGHKQGHKWYVDVKNGNDSSATNDGFSWETAFKTIQHAVDSCGNAVGDIIFVAPGKYQEQVKIYNHAGIKIIAPWGPWETQIRGGDGPIKYPFTPVGDSLQAGACFLIMSRSVEISGFCVDGGGAFVGIYIGDGYRVTTGYNANAASARVNNCLFTDGTTWGVVLDGCSDNVVIENNIFEKMVAGGVYICPGGSRTVQRPVIRYNEFIAMAGYGIKLYASTDTLSVTVRGNSFTDGATPMTYSCLFTSTGKHTFVGNYDCSANGASGSSTDIMSGNTEGHGMDAPKYIAES